MATAFRQGGLDLLQPFSLPALRNAGLPGLKPDTFDPRHRLGLVIGNTRALWPAFRRHLRGLGVRNPNELGPDPLDIYIEELIAGALLDLHESHGVDSHVVFAHDSLSAPLPIQRIADFAGLARLGPVHLSIHPQYGPWIALRAVISLELPIEAGIALGWDRPAQRPCDSCEVQCRKALSNALLGRSARLEDPLPPPPSKLSKGKARWLAVRDICPVGREHRYTDDQILYHYENLRDVLLP